MMLWGRLLLVSLLSLGAFTLTGVILQEPSPFVAALVFAVVRVVVSIVFFKEFLLSWRRSSESIYLMKAASSSISLGVCIALWQATFSTVFYLFEFSLYVLSLPRQACGSQARV